MTDTLDDKNNNEFQLFTCNCENTYSIDENKIGKNLQIKETPKAFQNLCRTQLSSFENEIKKNTGQKIIITCTQEAPVFKEIANEMHATSELSFVNIRENAGWSKTGHKATAKMSALIAQANYEVQPTGLMPIISHGTCIVYGANQTAMDVANKLSSHLSVTLLLSQTEDIIPQNSTDFPIFCGQISKAKGSIGKFKLVLNNFAPASPSSKQQLRFSQQSNDISIETDLIFDLSGHDPLFGSTHPRDGYFNINPNNATAISNACFDIIDLVGEFEKPIFVAYNKSICAHARSGQIGCSNCIDNCPTSAISSIGDHVLVNNEICDGCGHCSSSCPTGALSYAFPLRTDLIGRAQTMISTYKNSGGKNPILFIHESKHGTDIIAAISRFGDGLSHNTLPFSVHSITHIGHDALTAFFTAGIQTVVLLAPNKKRDELQALRFQIDLTNTFLEHMEFDQTMRVELLVEDDPDIIADHLQNIPAIKATKIDNFIASKNKRETARMAILNLNAAAPVRLKLLELPTGSPYGVISIDQKKCTLCLACVSACPANALSDNEDRPQVSFTEQSCVQCGLCKTTCPEKAISLTAQFNFDKSALSAQILNSEEPFECIRCSKPFGSKASIEKVIGLLQGKNPMFQTSQQMQLLKMCENCRVIAMAENEKDPMTFGTVPTTLTADDFLPEDDEPTKH